MRILIEVAIVLLIGAAVGYVLRPKSPPAGPPADAEVFTNDASNDTPMEEVDSEPSMAPPGWMSEFELTERDGQAVNSNDLKGSPYVVSFFFSTCPSICVQQNQKVKELQDEFAAKGVRFVSISVDPVTDTPDTLKEYAARFEADPEQWLFLTGELTYIRRVGAEIYRLPVDEKFHTEKLVLVDADGQIKGYYLWPEKKQFDKLRQDLQQLLDQPTGSVAAKEAQPASATSQDQ